ncbi:MAG: transcription antitermination factor NusB [Treponema sp.]|nr:transcription antitermination factor NusB [Treponema sp.]
MSRRSGRILAVQALYSYDVGKMQLEDLLKLEWTDDDFDSDHALAKLPRQGEKKNAEPEEEVPPAEPETETDTFARLLISGTVNHIDEIDAKIKSHLTGGWDFSRLNKVTVAILRVSLYAILFQKDIAPSIIIDEAIGIARDFALDDQFKFINAILDTIRKEENPQ